RCLTASSDNTARVWDAKTGRPSGPVMVHEGGVTGAAFSPDGRSIITGGADKTARLWEAGVENDGGTATVFSVAGFYPLAASPASSRVALVASSNGALQLLDFVRGGPLGDPALLGAWPASASFSLDGRWLLVTAGDNSVHVVNATNGRPVGKMIRFTEAPTALALSPDGRRLTAAGPAGTPWLWDAESGAAVIAAQDPGKIMVAAFSLDGAKVLTVGADLTARLWNPADGKPLGKPLPVQDSRTNASFSPDGNRVMLGGLETCRLYDARTGLLVAPPMRHDAYLSVDSFSADGTLVLTAAYDRTVRVWDAGTGRPVGKVMQHDGFPSAAVLSPDNRFVLTASFGG
ncbi:MAG: hypothetical protein AAB368_02550, partial [bacterium]